VIKTKFILLNIGSYPGLFVLVDFLCAHASFKTGCCYSKVLRAKFKATKNLFFVPLEALKKVSSNF
jgi:hypothetical protein